MKLEKMIKYTGEMELLSGLAIKGADNDLSIGGADSEVIKNPITKMPYVPGSSLKGKIRSLLELKYEKTGDERKKLKNKNEYETIEGCTPCKCGRKDCFVCTIFGAHMNPGAASAPTRIIVRDCSLAKESLELIRNLPLDSGFLEEKSENIINRNDGTAGSPRTMERVPAGLKFEVEIILQIFEGDSEQNMKEKVEEGLKLLENSYLGGSGSRGYGHVKFTGNWVEVIV